MKKRYLLLTIFVVLFTLINGYCSDYHEISRESLKPQWPLKTDRIYYITGLDYYRGGSKHNGIDVGNPGWQGEEVYPVANGTVIQNSNDNGYNSSMGYYVIIRHDVNGTSYYSRYMHFKKGSVPEYIHNGVQVDCNTVIGGMGNTGNSNGSHLHFDITNTNNGSYEELSKLRGYTFDYYINNTSALKNVRLSAAWNNSSGAQKSAYWDWITTNSTLISGEYSINSHQHAYKGADEHCIKCGEAYKPKVESMNNQKSNVIVAETSLKARPYQDSETISKVKRGTEVTLVNSYINAYGNLWYEVRCNGKSGYMYNDKVGSALSLSINMTDWPSSIKVGSSYGLRGTIKSNYSITKVEGYVQNSSGSNVLTSVDNPNSTSMNVRNANLNNKLAFNKLGEGDYRLIIKAHDNSGKVVTASKNFNVCREQQKAASSLSINLERYPVSLNQGSSFGLRGSVDSNYNISEVRGYVMDSAGNTVLSSRDYPNSTSMNIRYADLNNSLVFNRLGAGDYTMKVVAYDSSGRQAVATKNFSVYGGSSNNNSGAASSLSINMTSYPSSINQGSGFGLRGSIDSNYNITKVSGYVLDSSGNVVLSSTDYPNSASMNVRYANLNNDLVFNRLGSGNYTLKVVASDGVTSREWSSGFSVSGGQVSQGNVRTGIINIPSSWDNLSIRSGPGTGYQIVGSMNQGASCTVYTDKTQNGWYYVNYNGVTGYASGRQINLQ